MFEMPQFCMNERGVSVGGCQVTTPLPSRGECSGHVGRVLSGGCFRSPPIMVCGSVEWCSLHSVRAKKKEVSASP